MDDFPVAVTPDNLSAHKSFSFGPKSFLINPRWVCGDYETRLQLQGL
jgi:hypothetical protein